MEAEDQIRAGERDQYFDAGKQTFSIAEAKLDVNSTPYIAFSCRVTIESLGKEFHFHFIMEAVLTSPGASGKSEYQRADIP
jgi:hypothetical protein